MCLRILKISVAILFIFILLYSSCNSDKKVTATAICDEIELFESNLGYINVPQFVIGQCFWIDPTNHTAGQLFVLDHDESEVIDSPEIDSLKIMYSSNMRFEFSGDIPAAARSTLESQLSKSTELAIYGGNRTSIISAMDLVESDSIATHTIKDFQRNSHQSVVYIVCSVLTGKQLRLGVAGGSHVTANTSILKFGEFELKVMYRCEGLIQATGFDIPLFFKVVPIGYDEETEKLFIDTAQHLSLAEIDLVNAFR